MAEENTEISDQSDHPSLSDDYPFWLKAPFRLLTDVTQFRKVDPWDIEIDQLISRFVQQMLSTPDINFPVLGRAILSAAILYRTKVKDLIRLIEENDEPEEDLEALRFDIPEIKPSYHISQRPVSFNELIHAFKGLLKQEERFYERKKHGKKKVKISPLSIPAKPMQVVDKESTKIEKMKKDVYEKLVKNYLQKQRPIFFIELIEPRASRVSIVRLLLCILFLAFEEKAEVLQEEDLGTIKLIPIRDEEEEFLGKFEETIQKKLKEGDLGEEGVIIDELTEEELQEVNLFFSEEDE
ncbi:MAG: hypothetical protein GF308_02145 [Candidatus Heimdallarchaeota archaeon]|nr:hypothetical protein [Candidatus Heimdallarchaeota archaeon]